MFIQIIFAVLLARVGASTCPSIWSTIVQDLQQDLAGCTPFTSFAIRFAFHDAAGYSSQNPTYAPASGGADGSLLLNDEEANRPIQDPLQNFRQYLFGKYNNFKTSRISAADLVQIAGSVGTKSCPGGPVYKTLVGRTDSSQAAPDGTLPVGFGKGARYRALINLWADKGFDPRELAALIGAHSVSRSFSQQNHGIPPGGPQDTTPNAWDVTYYSETQNRTAPYSFDSDKNLADPSTASGKAFTEFAGDQDAWATAFSAAMYKLSVLGIPQADVDGFADCTSLIGAIEPGAAPPRGAPGSNPEGPSQSPPS